MKKLGIGIITAVLLLPVDITVEASPAKSTEFSVVDASSIGKKRKGYRKKKGFMWGLFRKKSGCGCPNH
ncbi:hypothetical protein [Tellurirhabdus bombi]|uniref:hypothetical protein n=1 Tax=Tellurirhabdus bombi TaxID=2907205 RepID=UPI001F400E65|nr:hypothetical protein [Tellurirhabdus bombi]